MTRKELRYRRIQHGLSAGQVGLLIRRAAVTVYRWEQGSQPITLEMQTLLTLVFIQLDRLRALRPDDSGGATYVPPPRVVPLRRKSPPPH